MTTKTQDVLIEKIRQGDVITYSKRQDLPQGSTQYYYLENPTDNGLIEIEGISAVAGTKTDVNIHYNVDQTSQGTSMHVRNHRVSSSEDLGITRQYNGSYDSLNDEPLEDTIPGGEGGAGPAGNVVGGKNSEQSISISPGNNVLFEFVNNSSSDGYIAPKFTVTLIDK